MKRKPNPAAKSDAKLSVEEQIRSPEGFDLAQLLGWAGGNHKSAFVSSIDRLDSTITSA